MKSFILLLTTLMIFIGQEALSSCHDTLLEDCTKITSQDLDNIDSKNCDTNTEDSSVPCTAHCHVAHCVFTIPTNSSIEDLTSSNSQQIFFSERSVSSVMILGPFKPPKV